MERADVIKLVDLIQLHRPYFRTHLGEGIYKDLINEWERIMKPYEYQDIYNNLEKFLKDEDNYGKEPNAYQLIQDLLTAKQKNNKGKTFIYCDVCRKPLQVFINDERNKMNRTEADAHISRCHSIRYLKQLYSKYFMREILIEDIQNMKKMSQQEFDKVYYKILEKAYEHMNEGKAKQLLKNVLETKNEK